MAYSATAHVVRAVGTQGVGRGLAVFLRAPRYEIFPTDDPQPGPRMAPVIDDVRIVYMAWDTVTVLEEVELVD